MSKVGKRIISIPEGVNVEISPNNIVKITGKLGTLEKAFNTNLVIKSENNEITVDRKSNDKKSKMIHGTTNSLISNMVEGVSKGYSKTLEILGIGYSVKISGTTLTFALGLSHKVVMEVPSHLKAEATKPTILVISGIDNQQVGEFAASIKRLRKPEPYGGKGIRYQGEYIIRKQGKSGA